MSHAHAVAVRNIKTATADRIKEYKISHFVRDDSQLERSDESAKFIRALLFKNLRKRNLCCYKLSGM